mmetsp:Transcript_23372/g.52452  ORF Transcript_23372/g.52452 Transcript_23372/m.52452 type:complete len:322 (-) Transcript_23372:412-1377(-)
MSGLPLCLESAVTCWMMPSSCSFSCAMMDCTSRDRSQVILRVPIGTLCSSAPMGTPSKVHIFTNLSAAEVRTPLDVQVQEMMRSWCAYRAQQKRAPRKDKGSPRLASRYKSASWSMGVMADESSRSMDWHRPCVLCRCVLSCLSMSSPCRSLMAVVSEKQRRLPRSSPVMSRARGACQERACAAEQLPHLAMEAAYCSFTMRAPWLDRSASFPVVASAWSNRFFSSSSSSSSSSSEKSESPSSEYTSSSPLGRGSRGECTAGGRARRGAESFSSTCLGRGSVCAEAGVMLTKPVMRWPIQRLPRLPHTTKLPELSAVASRG